jgi:hypothetical protein
MAEMELGYGSKYQLLRFLGHHRNELEQYILKNTKINENLEYSMEWLDYPKDAKRKSLDGEYTGISFLPLELQNKISGNWKNYWPQQGNPPNWDSIIYCSPLAPNSSLEDHWFIIEAKARLNEGIDKGTDAKNEESIKIIEKAFEKTKKRFNIKTENNWLEKYYQFANRLAFINFMLENGVQCSLLYIYFINGWPNDPKNNVTNIESWKEIIHDEYKYLGINDEAKKYISEIFVNC